MSICAAALAATPANLFFVAVQKLLIVVMLALKRPAKITHLKTNVRQASAHAFLGYLMGVLLLPQPIGIKSKNSFAIFISNFLLLQDRHNHAVMLGDRMTTRSEPSCHQSHGFGLSVVPKQAQTNRP
ncbi:hypothetical protein [Lampropedia hyalina]|jgi:hypothetical protein|uniref:hypothetical protein n=1 Tax=Lampropedia hyalina TaxID=198706 RepID=UPI000933C0B8|nr:hypothetical protein [Lampropedia hyalina]